MTSLSNINDNTQICINNEINLEQKEYDINGNLKIFLTPDQAVNFQNIIKITNQNSMVLDTSPTGCGKTITTIEYLRVRKIQNAIVICNNSLQVKHWTKFKEKYNAPIFMILSYDTLRGSKTVETSDGRFMIPHRLLYKDKSGNFEPTEFFMNIVEYGNFCLIADECHSIKNDRSKTAAFKTLSRYITIRNRTAPYPKNRSWSFFLSMTPFDKMEHCVNFLSTCGIITSSELYSKSKDCPTGINELHAYCKHFDKEKTDTIWGLYDIKYGNSCEVAYKLTANVFLRLVATFSKNSRDGYKSKQSIYYSYSDIPQEAHIMMKKSLEMIKSPVRVKQIDYQPKQIIMTDEEKYVLQQYGNIANNKNLNDQCGVIKGIVACQTIKTFYIIIPLVRNILKQVPNAKIVIFLDYIESIDIVMKHLAEFLPVKITGDPKCTKDRRDEIINKFNEPNLEIQILTMISQIGSDSIEIDDRNGNFPRIGIGLPDFYYSRFFQCPGRIYRRFTESNSLFFWCLVNTVEYSEESVFKSIADKSAIMEETLQNNEIIPPIYHAKIINPHLNNFNEMLRIAGKNTIKNIPIAKNVVKRVVNVSQSSFKKSF